MRVVGKCIFALSLIFSGPAWAESPCDLKLTLLESKSFPGISNAIRESREKTFQYLKEVYQSPYYLRLFIKGEEESLDLSHGDLGGFFPPREPQTGWLSLRVKKVSGQILAKTKAAEIFKNPRLSGLSLFFIESVALLGVFDLADLGWPYFLGGLVDARVLWQYESLGQVLRYDYRYYPIKMRLKNKELSEFDARKAVYLLNIAYRNYFKYMVTQYHDDNLSQQLYHLHDHVLFSHVVDFAEKGVYTTNDYFAVHPGPLDGRQIEDLLDIHHKLYLGQQVISDWTFKVLKPSEKVVLDRILAEPFEKELLRRYNFKQLSSLELMYFVQLDLDLRRYFSEQRILQIVPFERVHGQPTLKLNSDTLEDLQTVILAHIDHRIDMP